MIRGPLRAIWPLLAMTVLLAACQTPPVPQTHFTRADQIHRWHMNGKLGYRTAHDGGSANFDWREEPDNGVIHFSGPLGFGGAKLTWRPGQAVLNTSRGTYHASTPGILAWHLTGFWLPVSALEYWSRGLPWPDAPKSGEQRDKAGNLIHLRQLGWTLDFDRYRNDGKIALPHRIKANRGDDRFILLIDQWQPLP